MNSIKLSTDARTALAGQYCFGMPISAHAFGTATPDAVVRERGAVAATGTKGATGFAPSFLPGTSAWRPPTC